MSTKEDIPFILEQVSKCLRLAAASNDGEISARLLKLAQAFARRAIELGADPALIPKRIRPKDARLEPV